MGKVDAAPGDTLAQTAITVLPLWFDAGWRFASWFVGFDASYAPGLIGNALGAACTACLPQDMRLGIEVKHYLAVSERAWDPWVGVGAGYEWLLVTALGGSGLAGLQGVEIANVQFGLDQRGAGGYHIGPFAAMAVGEYLSEFPANINPNAAQVPTSLHAWLMFGLQVTWGPFPRRN